MYEARQLLQHTLAAGTSAMQSLSGYETQAPVEPHSIQIAVLIPCYNEGTSIERVVRDFRATLPTAKIVVFDNNSTDDTAEAARTAGAQVYREIRQGKGFVVRRMFADLDADVYVLVDGDAT